MIPIKDKYKLKVRFKKLLRNIDNELEQQLDNPSGVDLQLTK